MYGGARRESLMDARGYLPQAGAARDITGVIPIENEKRIIDWNAIRAEFIGGASYGDIAKKYRVSKSTIHKHAKEDDWQTLRTNAANEARTLSVQRMANAAADNATLAANIKRMGLEIIAGLFADYAEHVTATEHRETKGKTTDIKRLRDLTAAYKDLTGDMVTNQAEDNALLRSLYDIERGMRDD